MKKIDRAAVLAGTAALAPLVGKGCWLCRGMGPDARSIDCVVQSVGFNGITGVITVGLHLLEDYVLLESPPENLGITYRNTGIHACRYRGKAGKPQEGTVWRLNQKP